MKKKIAVLFLCLAFLFVCQTPLKAQLNHIQVTITVKNIFNEVMPGVSIMTSIFFGGVTDVDGKLIIWCNPYATLDVTYTGYEEQHVEVNNRSAIVITMREDQLAYVKNALKRKHLKVNLTEARCLKTEAHLLQNNKLV